MFPSQKEFNTWLKKQSDAQLLDQLSHLNKDEMAKLYAIYEEADIRNGDYSVHQVLDKLGEAIAGLVQLVAPVKAITTGAEKKQFVMENIVNISRLIDEGVDGTENNIHREVEGFGFLDDSDAPLQAAFIRPMADRAIESLWDNSV